jgi:hypothetical protein
MTAKNLQQRELEKYWTDLGASNPSVQTLAGNGTGAHFNVSEPAVVARPQSRNPRGPQIS